MDQPDPSNYAFGYDMNAWIRDFCLQNPAGANASGPSAYQVVEDDRFIPLPDESFQWQPNAGLPSNSSLSSHCNNVHDNTPGIFQFDETTTYDTVPRYENEPHHDHNSSWVSCFNVSYPAITTTEPLDAAAPNSSVDRMPCFEKPHLTHTQFQSGMVVLEDKSSLGKKPKLSKVDTGIKCQHPDCEGRGSFNRKYDLQRHMARHDTMKKEKCPVESCTRFYTRYDKLRYHMSTAHDDGEVIICSVQGCNMRVPFLLAARHMLDHEHLEGVVSKAFRRFGDDWRSCPIPSCKHNVKKLRMNQMQEHLRTHDLKERHEYTEVIHAAGYTVSNAETICPVCKRDFQTLQKFREHMEDEHLSSNGSELREIRVKEAWRQREVRLYGSAYYGRVFHSLWNIEPRIETQLLDDATIRRIEKLKPYKDFASHGMAILRLWPDFQYHPIFDSYMPTLPKHSGGTSMYAQRSPDGRWKFHNKISCVTRQV